MRMLKARGVRNVLLASGTLSPIQAFTHNMGLNFGSILENEHALKQVPVLTSVVTRGKIGGLIGSYQNRKNPTYLSDVAETLIRVMEVTPQGVLIFFSSYSQMDDMVEAWKTTKRTNSLETLWQKMEKSKKVVVEPRAKDGLSAIRIQYSQGVTEAHGAALLAVCRGKVSEGIDFCDAESRAVVIIGIPYPPIHDERVVLKKAYLDDMMMRKNTGGERLSSQDWYQMEAFRAVNQAIGRVLRHKDDFGTVVLLDSRYASAKQEMFPKWLRATFGKCDLDVCAKKTLCFFNERRNLIETSKSNLIKKQEKQCKMYKQPKKTGTQQDPRNIIHETTLEELYSPANLKMIKSENLQRVQPVASKASSSSSFGLPTNEDELEQKTWEQENGLKPSTSSENSLSMKRKLKVDEDKNEHKDGNKRKKIFLLTHETLPARYQKALEIPTSELIKEMSEENKKQFTATLKAYKTSDIQWQELFQRLRPIFVPKRADLFISISNILRSEDKIRFLKKAIENKIY
uniref:HELICc2 domain-containing protein n=1 Tax=Caenorhabditis japonica TaxID=281687 RepID=A0A8R1I0U9_CAEJA